MGDKFFYTYVLRSLKDDQLYIGWTDNLEKRLADHGEGRVKSTQFRRPFKVVYYEACLSRKQAINREKSLKTGYGRAYLKRRLK